MKTYVTSTRKVVSLMKLGCGWVVDSPTGGFATTNKRIALRYYWKKVNHAVIFTNDNLHTKYYKVR